MTTTLKPVRQPEAAADDFFDALFERSFDFHIQLDWDDAIGFVRYIEEYNDFEAPAVIAALEQIDRMIPRSDYGPDNPNTGRRDFTISVGREGSPAIYLERYELGYATPLSEYEMRAICREMQVVGRADEATYHVADLPGFRGRKIEFRFWWD